MKAEAIMDFYVVNGEVQSTGDQTIFQKISKPPIYEIIRVIDGVPIYLEDHLGRMFESAKLLGKSMDVSESYIREYIKMVIKNNKIDMNNIKLLWGEADKVGEVFMVYSVESFYPPKEYYDNGIKTILYNHERDNPNAKVQVSSFKDDVAKKMKDADAFEALLVRDDGYIPEGSRSNIFFVKEDSLYTAPKDEILLGITRKHMFKIADMLNIKIVEESIHTEDLNKIDGAFITGTSINMLPISIIDNVEINSAKNKIIGELNKVYMDLIRGYIEKNKDLWK